MSNIPISSLPLAISLTGSETVAGVQAGTTVRIPVSLINSTNPANLPIGGLTGQGLVKQSNANYDTKWATISGTGTVQEVDTGTGLTGGPITLMGTVALASIATGNVLANTSGISAAPIPTTPSAVLDVIGSVRGDILYRGVSGWAVLAPGSAGRVLTSAGAGADPTWNATGSGSVTSVGLALPAIFTISGSPVTTSGTLTGTLATQAANLVWAGPTTGVAAAPTFRSLVGADIPNPSATTLGGIQSTVGASHQWVSSISTLGVPGLSQPAFSDISGQATGAQLPNPSATTLGGVESLAAVTSHWINTISTSGVPSATQPAFSDISGNAALAQLPSIGNNTILANTSGGSSTPSATSLTTLLDTLGTSQGSVLYRNASTWVPLTPGSAGQVLTTGGPAANPSWGTVTGTGTVTSISAGTGIDTGGSPITGAGTVALAAVASNRILANITGGSAAPIANTMTSLLDIIGATQGQILYRGASSWTALAAGTSGQYLQTLGAGSTPQWAAPVTSVIAGGGAVSGTGGQTAITSTGTIYAPTGSSNKLRNSSLAAWFHGFGSLTITTAGGWGAEGIFIVPAGASVAAQQVANGLSNPLTFLSQKITGATSVTGLVVRFVIESYDAAPLAGQQVTFQVPVLNNTGGSITPTITVKRANAQDTTYTNIDVSAQNMQTITNGSTGTLAYSWTANASSFNGLSIDIDFGNNFSTSGKSIQIGGGFDCRVTPGVSTGTVANPPTPEIRGAAEDIAWCERFYQTSYENGTGPGSVTHVGVVGGTYFGNSVFNGPVIYYRTPMRAAFNPSYWDGAGNASKVSGLNGTTWTDNGTNVTTLAPATKSFIFQITANGPAGVFSLYFHYATDATLTGG